MQRCQSPRRLLREASKVAGAVSSPPYANLSHRTGQREQGCEREVRHRSHLKQYIPLELMRMTRMSSVSSSEMPAFPLALPSPDRRRDSEIFKLG